MDRDTSSDCAHRGGGEVEGVLADKFAKEIKERVNEIGKIESNLNLILDRAVELEEVNRAIKKLKRGKAAGIDNYMNEIFMYGGDKLKEATWKLIERVFKSEQYPQEWARGIIFPLFKGGPKEYTYDPSKYRGITLLCTGKDLRIDIK